MILKKYSYAIYLVVVVGSIFLILEFVSLKINRSRGIEFPFFFASGGSVENRTDDGRFLSIDPHLGYARSDTERQVEKFRSRYPWYRGFAIYSNEPMDRLERPLVLTLGGSTTDPLNYTSSWPEELAILLEEQGISGTVVNGAVGGYSSNQELLKLIRDGIEFHPDLVISYSGVNDRGRYGSLPHPMVHSYQRELLGSLVQRGLPPVLPNTISLLSSLREGDEDRIRYTLGLETKRTLGEWYARNLSLMNAVAQASGARFIGIVQPNAYVGSYEWAADFRDNGKSAKYQAAIGSLYNEIENLPAQADYVYSAIDIFDGIEDVYLEDGIHNTEKGFGIIAEYVLELIRTETEILGSSG